MNRGAARDNVVGLRHSRRRRGCGANDSSARHDILGLRLLVLLRLLRDGGRHALNDAVDLLLRLPRVDDLRCGDCGLRVVASAACGLELDRRGWLHDDVLGLCRGQRCRVR